MTSSEHTSYFTSPAIVGETVSGVSEGPGYRTAWSGIYDGVKPSEWDGEPVHFFRLGIIGETPQTTFAIPVGQFLAWVCDPATCDDEKHDHTSHIDAEGYAAEGGAVPMVCAECGRPAFYDYTTDRYRHNVSPDHGCFLIPAEVLQ